MRNILFSVTFLIGSLVLVIFCRHFFLFVWSLLFSKRYITVLSVGRFLDYFLLFSSFVYFGVCFVHCTCDVLLFIVLFCVIVFFGYFLFSLFLFLHGLHPLDRVYHSFFILFFYNENWKKFYIVYVKKKRKKRKRTSITKGRKLWYYLFLFLSNTLNL